MKIKYDFVTNSSSTCFVLQYDCYLEKIIEKEVDCKETLDRVFDKFFIKDKSEVDQYSNDQSGSVKGKYNIDKDFPDDEKLDEGVMNIELINSQTYSEKDDEAKNTILLNLKATSLLLNGNPKIKYTNKLMEIIQEALINVEGDLEIFFHQFPVEVGGDGWDTGDPMGQYSTQYELFNKQTKIGKIIRKNGNWSLKLK